MSANQANDPLQRLVEEMGEKLRQSYAQGWKDAMAAVKKAAEQNAPEGFSLSPSEGPNTPPQPRGSRGAEPVEGSTPWYVLNFVRKRRGTTPFEIIEGLKSEGHSFSEAHVRTSLQRLKVKRHLAVRNGRWFPN